jgi:SAM-dependent methyltransferase
MGATASMGTIHSGDSRDSGEQVGVDIFGAPCLWRDQAAVALGLHDEAVLAALSPGAAFPAALRTIASTIPTAVRTVVDLGAGAGGASEWLRQAMGVEMIAIEPAPVAREVAARRFPMLDVREGQADRTGLPDHVADVVVLSGIVSLLDDLDGLMAEVVRLLRRHGFVAIADLFPADSVSFRSAPNTFRSFECVESALTLRGFQIASVGCGPPEPDAAWSDVARRVDDWIEANCSHLDGFRQFRADQAHLKRHVDAGDVLGGCVVAQRALV